MRKTIPLAITFLAGALVLIDFFFKVPGISGSSQTALNYSIVVAAFASALGGANLLRIHLNKVRDQKDSWQLSVILLVVMLFFVGLGVYQKPSGKDYQFFFNILLQPLSATLFSANAFFITSAAYRAFRIKTAEAAVLASPLPRGVMCVVSRYPDRKLGPNRCKTRRSRCLAAIQNLVFSWQSCEQCTAPQVTRTRGSEVAMDGGVCSCGARYQGSVCYGLTMVRHRLTTVR